MPQKQSYEELLAHHGMDAFGYTKRALQQKNGGRSAAKLKTEWEELMQLGREECGWWLKGDATEGSACVGQGGLCEDPVLQRATDFDEDVRMHLARNYRWGSADSARTATGDPRARRPKDSAALKAFVGKCSSTCEKEWNAEFVSAVGITKLQ